MQVNALPHSRANKRPDVLEKGARVSGRIDDQLHTKSSAFLVPPTGKGRVKPRDGDRPVEASSEDSPREVDAVGLLILCKF